MKSKTTVLMILLTGLMVTGCAGVQTEYTSETSSITSITIPSEPEDKTDSETAESSETTVYHRDDGDGSQFVSKCNFDIADEAQGAGYIPLLPDQVEDPAVRKMAEELYEQQYSLCDLKYLGKAMAGLAHFDDGSQYGSYFNTGVEASKIVPNKDDDGDHEVMIYLIRMTEQQFDEIMLDSFGVRAYLCYNYDPDAEIELPEGTDDGTVRHIENEKGNYIEYHRDTGICVLYADESTCPQPETTVLDD